jgi:hypothetical protein
MSPADANFSPAPSDDAQDITMWPHSTLQMDPSEVTPDTDQEAPESAPVLNQTLTVGWTHKWPPKKFDIEDVKCEIEVTFSIQGSYAPTEEGTVQSQATFDNQGFTEALSTDIEWGDWEIEPKLEFGKPKQKKKDGAQSDDPPPWEVAIDGSCSFTRKFTSDTLDWLKGEAKITFTAVGLELTKEQPKAGAAPDPDDDMGGWTCEAGEIKISGSGGGNVSGDFPAGWAFPGHAELAVELEIEGKGELDLLKLAVNKAMETYGTDLGCDALIGLAIPLAIVVAGVASIVVACEAIFEIWELEDMRDETIPSLRDKATQGYMDGLNGLNEGDEKAKVSDEKQAGAAGACAGTKKRKDIIAKKCNGDPSLFDDWMTQNGDQVQQQASAKFQETIEVNLWTQKAKEYADAWSRSLPGGDYQALKNQQHAWLCIIQNPPTPGKWMDLWLSLRVNDSTDPGLRDGNW